MIIPSSLFWSLTIWVALTILLAIDWLYALGNYPVGKRTNRTLGRFVRSNLFISGAVIAGGIWLTIALYRAAQWLHSIMN